MELNKKAYALPTICKMQKKIDPTPDYQRPPVWTRKQKQMLMDTVFRNYDIPKFYWRQVSRDDGVQYEVIDGQQRLRTIWEFEADQFPLAKDIEEIAGHAVAGLKYSELPTDVMEIFDMYQLDVVIVTDAQDMSHEEEIRDMFLRLQNGTTLKAQEKRNAMTGDMRDFVTAIAKHKFFEKCKFSNSRFTFDHVAAQCILIELKGGRTGIKDANLNRMYADNKVFEKSGKQAKKVERTFDFLLKAFPEETPELDRYNVISLYCMASNLIDGYVATKLPKPLSKWFINFEQNRRENDHKPKDERSSELVEYKGWTSYYTDAEETVRARVEYLSKLFFKAYPDIETKDATRDFTQEQRLAIFRRDKGQCQIKNRCNGEKVGWKNWHADHIIPHSKGGKTTVSNGQLACIACNLAKGAT